MNGNDGDGGDGAEGAGDGGFATRALHAGRTPDAETGAFAPAIHQSAAYVFPDADEAADRYALESDGHVYSRVANPTVERLEERIASLEGGAGAVATASGMAALDAVTFLLAGEGDAVVYATDTYGGTASYLSTVATRRGVEARPVPTTDYDAYREAVDEGVAFVHVETLGNPSLVTPDLERVAAIAHEAGAPLVVDNTFATPALCRPLDHGADVVWESTTKWLHGQGTTLGGVVVDGGSFPWREHADRYPELARESPAFPGTIFARDFDAPVAAATRHRAVRALGSAQSPFDAWVTLQGVSTLPLRMDRHCENAEIVAEYLADHSDVAWVSYPGLADHETHGTAAEYLDGYGGMVAFGLRGRDGEGDGDADAERAGRDDENGDATDARPTAYDAGRRLAEELEVGTFAANIGDARTLVIHPASTTHAQLSAAEQREAGVTPDLLRLSVGLEDPADLLADLDAAIERALDGAGSDGATADAAGE